MLFGKKPGAGAAAPAAMQAPAAAQQAVAQALSPEAAEAQHRALAQLAFGTIGQVEHINKGDHAKEGRYLWRIEKLLLKKSTNPQKAMALMVIMEATCLFCLEEVPGKPAHRPGDKVGQVFDFSKGSGPLGAFKDMVAKILDIPIDQVGPEASTEVTSPSQPFAGTVVEVNNRLGWVGKEPNRKPFTFVNYIRSVPFSELLQGAQDPEAGATLLKFFSMDFLQKAAAAETAPEQASA